MKNLLIALSIVFFNHVFSQDSLSWKRWNFLNKYELSTYFFSFGDKNYDQFPFWEGSEASIDLISFRSRRHEVTIASGLFFVDRKPEEKINPHMQYFYFPINLSYTLYSKNLKYYGKLILGTTLLSIEDSRYTERDKFWINYEEATAATPYRSRMKIYGIYQLKFGYNFTRHFGINAGGMSYMYSTINSKMNLLGRFSFGLEYRL